MISVDGCTITSNAASEGGGIANFQPGGVVYLKNSTLGANTPDNIFGSYIDLGGNTFYP